MNRCNLLPPPGRGSWFTLALIDKREHDCTDHVMIARKTGITFSDITRSPAPEAAWRMSAVYTRRGSAGIFASVSDGLAQVMAFD